MSFTKSKAIVKIIINGSLLADFLLIAVLSVAQVTLEQVHPISALTGAIGVFLFLVVCALVLRAGNVKLASRLVVVFYYGLAIFISIVIGLGSAFSILIYCLFILITGVLLGGTPLVRATLIAIISLYILQIVATLELLSPPVSTTSFGNIAAYSVFFGIFALIGWVTATQAESYLRSVRQAKAELVHQKTLLAQALENEEVRLKRMQIKELNDVYKLAEIGQQTTLLFHEFANQLMDLSFDIDENTSHSRKHAQSTLKDIEKTMQQVRQQLSVENHEAVDVHKIVSEVLKDHRPKLRASSIRVNVIDNSPRYKATVFGDSLKLRQVLNILIDNAIQSYGQIDRRSRRLIKIIITTTETSASISITDFGIGISQSQRKKLFEASHTTKINGHGIGLYVTKRTIERQFRGTLKLDDATDKTEFNITLRRIN